MASTSHGGRPDGGHGQGPGAEADPRAAFGPWETYETAEGDGWSGGYGVVPEQAWAPSYDDPAEPAHDAAPAGAGSTRRSRGHARPRRYGRTRRRGSVRRPGPVPDEALRPAVGGGTEYARETSDSLTTESLLHGKRAAPGSGWRRSVYRATGGLVRVGESAAEMRRRDLINRVRTPVAGGHHRVAVLSLKGGVGKTTTAVGLGATLATLRGDRVIAVDANPDRGTLSDKVRLETAATIRDLLNERDQVSRYADVRAFTSQASSRLEVLASDRDPGCPSRSARRTT